MLPFKINRIVLLAVLIFGVLAVLYYFFLVAQI
jgi:hypothetical protein